MGVCWPALSQRGQQAPLPVRLADSQMFPAPVQLVKLQLHRRLLGIQYGASLGLVFWPSAGSVPGSPLGSIDTPRNWSFAVRTQECSHNPNEISALRAELVFREIPG